MKKQKLIQGGAFHLRQKIFKEFKKLRYSDKRIKKFTEIKSIIPNLIIFSAEDKENYVWTFDFWIKPKNELEKQNILDKANPDGNRKSLFVYVEEDSELLRKNILDFFLMKEAGTRNEKDFIDYLNKSIEIVSKDKQLILFKAIPGTHDEDVHLVDAWILAKNKRNMRKYAVQIKTSESGIRDARIHVNPKRPVLLVRYDMNKRPKPGDFVRKTEEAILELRRTNKRTELIF